MGDKKNVLSNFFIVSSGANARDGHVNIPGAVTVVQSRLDFQMGPEYKSTARWCQPQTQVAKSHTAPDVVDGCFCISSPLTLEALASKSRISASSFRGLS